MKESFRFRKFTFFPDSGRLVLNSDNGESTIALAPQPAKLLTLLIENHPAMVSHETIQEELWPDVIVDYERSVHFCIRQIRSSLGDNAAKPIYIETIPRRGYRWIAPLDRTLSDYAQLVVNSEGSNLDSRPKKSINRALAILLVALFVAFFAWFISGNKFPFQFASQKPNLRVAIMPFEPESASNSFKANDIALRLVEGLTRQTNNQAEIIGPSTTTIFKPGQLKSLIEEYDPTFIINGRFSEADGQSRLLAEIIQADNGAHVWVQYFDKELKYEQIADEIIMGFLPLLQKEK